MPEDIYDAVLDVAPPPIGHNNPPEDDTRTPEQKRVDDLMEAANAWLSTVKEITDEETAKACDDFLKQIKDEAEALEKDRRARNKPLEDQVKANNDYYRPLTTLLDKAKALLTPLKTAWLQREKARLAEEKRKAEEEALRKLQEAEEAKRAAAGSVQAAVQADEAQKAAEEAMANVAALEKAKPQVKGNYAAKASGLRTYWSAVIVDQAKAVAHYANHPKVVALVQQLADADAREHKDKLAIPGVEAKKEEKAA
jgi:hypothetical protein